MAQFQDSLQGDDFQVHAQSFDIESRRKSESHLGKKKDTTDRTALFSLARACQGELKRQPAKNVLKGTLASQLREVRFCEFEIMSNLERLQECMDRIRPQEQRDTYEDIKIDNIKEELQKHRKQEAETAKVAGKEIREAQHPRQFLREQYIKCMQEFG